MSLSEAIARRTQIEAELAAVDQRIELRVDAVTDVFKQPEILIPAALSLGAFLGGLPPPRAYAVLRRISRGYPMMSTALRFFTATKS